MNTNKTKTMIISNNKNRSCIDRHCFYFGPNQLESCTEYKYLGVIINNKGKLNELVPDCRISYCRFHFAESHIADFC